MESVTTKVCSVCRKEKDTCEFHKCHGYRDGLQAACKVCKLAQNRRWRESNPEKVRTSKKGYRERNHDVLRENQRAYMESHKVEIAECRRRWNLSKRYGISMADFAEIIDRQGGGCAVCGRSGGRQCVDHDHKTGEVRGILCVRCNVAIGSLGDDVSGLMRAVRYLERAN